MAITIFTDLDKQVPSGNPDWLTCWTSNYNMVAGTKGIWTFTMTAQPATDSLFTFTFGEFVVIMTAKVSPDAKGYQTNKPTDVATFATFIDFLKANYLLNKHFVITFTAWSGGGTFTFTQREIDADTVLVATFSVSPDSKTSQTSTTAFVAKQFQENFKLMCDIMQMYDLTDLTKLRLIATLESKPGLVGANYTSTFDLQRVLRSLVSYSPPVTIDSNTGLALCPEMISYFGYKLYEEYGDPIYPYNLLDNSQPATPWQVILSRELFADHPIADWNDYYTAATYNKFLNSRPQLIPTNAFAPQYLYFYVKAGKTEARTYYQVYYEDGTDSGAILWSTLTMGTHKGKIMLTAVGYETLLIAALDPTKIVDYYKVWIADSAVVRISEYYSFSVDLANYENNNYLLFSCARGGFDTAWMRGELGFNKEYFGTDTVKAILPSYARGNFNTRNTGSQWMYEFNSGRLNSREEMRHICLIAEAEEIYYWNAEGGGQNIKLIIDRKSIEMVDNTMESLYSVSFKCRVANLELE